MTSALIKHVRRVVALSSVLLLGGCAVHFANPRSGRELLVGLGRFQMQTNACGTNLVAVRSGSLVPGLCLAVGTGSVGCQLGVIERQSIIAAPTEAGQALEWPRVRGIALHPSDTATWALGLASMRTVARPAGHTAIVTGGAQCGVAAQAGDGSFVHVGFRAWQGVALADGATLDLASTNAGARLDLFTVQVFASTNIDRATQNEQ